MRARVLRLILPALTILAVILPTVVSAEVPREMNYQGFLTDPTGVPINGTVNFQFAIFPDSTGVEPCWGREDHLNVQVDRGLFELRLGKYKPITISCLDGTTQWLQIWVNGAPLTGRRPISSAAYAIKSGDAGGAGDVTDVLSGTGISVTDPGGPQPTVNLDAAFVDARFVNEGQTNAVTSAMVTDNTLTADDLLTPVVSSVEGVTNDGGNIDLIQGPGITIVADDNANTITLSATTSTECVTDVLAGTGIVVTNPGGPQPTVSLDANYSDSRYVNEGQADAVSSSMVTDNSLTATDLLTNVVSSVDGITNDGADIDLVAGGGVTITPNNTAKTITITATNTGDVTDVVAGTGVLVTNPGGPQPTVSLDTSYADGHYVNEAQANSVTAAMVTDNTLTATDLLTNVVSSIDGVTNDGADVDFVAGSGITIMPNDAANTVTFAATNTGDVTDVVAGTGVLVANPGGPQPTVSLDTAYADGRYVNESQADAVTSAMVVDNTLTAADLLANVVSSVDGVTNDGGDIDFVAGSGITITPNDAANTITISSTATGTGDVTDVLAGTGILVTLPGGPQPTVSLDTGYADGRYVSVAGTQTVSGQKTFSAGTTTFQGVTATGDITTSGTLSAGNDVSITDDLTLGTGSVGLLSIRPGTSTATTKIYSDYNDGGAIELYDMSTSRLNAYMEADNGGFLGLMNDASPSIVRIAAYGNYPGSGGMGRMDITGDLHVSGTISKGGGSFKIDHPLDPENKYLYHSFVESPDMMNVYNGNAVLDPDGRAVIKLPDWFQALNRDFRYQLTCIGSFEPVFIEREVENNQFVIAGGRSGTKVSWQVTGIRQDKWANQNRIPVEEDKSPDERGKYQHPSSYGLPESRGIVTPVRARQEVGSGSAE
jgi:hypothetical protein